MISMSFECYENYCEKIKEFTYHADDYCPTEEEIKSVPISESYMRYLIWVDITGYVTDENAEDRKFLRKYLYQHLDLIDEEEERCE